MGWKYIMLEDKLTRLPVLFPDRLVHLEVFTVMKLLGVPEFTCNSAGMVSQLYVGGISGKSTTMQVRSRKNDQDIINYFNYQHGIKP